MLLALLLLGGCRDRYLATGYDNGPLTGGERFLFTDLDRMVVVSMNVSGQAADIIPTLPDTGLPGDGPMLSTSPRGGLMPITRRDQNSYITYTAHRLDGSLHDRQWIMATDPRSFIEGSFILSPNASWYAMFTLEADASSVLYKDLYLFTQPMTRGTYSSVKVGDPEHQLVSSPRFSPDGSRIAFLRSLGTTTVELVTVGLDGSDEWSPLGGPMPSDRKSPRLDWSPDGVRIAVGGIWSPPAIVIVAPETGDVDMISSGSIQNVRGMSWSPDGAAVAFSGKEGDNEDVYIATLATGQIRNVTRTSGESEHSPEWSPDGRRLLYVIANREDGSGTPAVYDLQQGVRRVYPGRTAAPFWAR